MKKILALSFVYLIYIPLLTTAQGVWNKVTEHPALNGLYGPSGNAVNGNIYICWGVMQGSVPSAAIYAYNISTDTWTQKRDFPGYGRYGSTSFVIGNTIYYMGGTVGQPPYYNDLWAYNTLTDTWSQKASMPGSGRIVAMAFSINGKGYITGGATDNISYLRDTWEYNPASNTWAQKASIPTYNNTGIVAASSFVLNSKGYVCGGKYALQRYLDSTWQYDPNIDKWESKARLPQGAGKLGGFGFSLNENTSDPTGYYGMGIDSIYLEPQGFYEYNPRTNIWKRISPFAGNKRFYGISCVVNNQAYIGFGDSDYASGTFEKDIWRLSFPVSSDTLSISGKIHQGNNMLKNGKVVAHNVTNDSTYAVITDTLGNFFLQQVSSGKYILYALPNAGEKYNQTFYPNTSDPYKTDTLILGKSIFEIDLYMNPSKTDSDSSESLFNEFNVYPNPFTDHLNITCLKKNTNTGFSKIQIDNVSGGMQKEIFLDKETYSYDIHLEQLPSGFYILKIPTDTGVYLKKIIK